MVRGYCISSSVGGDTGEVLPYVSLIQPNCLFYIISGGGKICTAMHKTACKPHIPEQASKLNKELFLH